MQTFLPYPDFDQSATCLDRQRLGKQRVEALTILRTLINCGGWSNQPAVRMWRGHTASLAEYGLVVCGEWVRRGYQDRCADLIRALPVDGTTPWWLGNYEFHASHRSNLLRKDLRHYHQFQWREVAWLPYIWPEP